MATTRHGGPTRKYLKVPANTLVPASRRTDVQRRARPIRLAGSGTAYRRAAAAINLSCNDTIAIFRPGNRWDWRPPNTPRRWVQGLIALDISPAAASTAPRPSAPTRSSIPGRNDPVGCDQGPHPTARYADLTLDTFKRPGCPVECDPQHQGVGHDVLCRPKAATSISTSVRILLRRQLDAGGRHGRFSNIIQAEVRTVSRFEARQSTSDNLSSPIAGSIDQAGRGLQLFDRQVDGKGVFLM